MLRCAPKILEKRLRARGWNEKKIHENVLSEILDICLIESMEKYGMRLIAQLITSRHHVKSCVSLAKQILSHRKLKKVSVDWLSELAFDPSSKYLK